MGRTSKASAPKTAQQQQREHPVAPVEVRYVAPKAGQHRAGRRADFRHCHAAVVAYCLAKVGGDWARLTPAGDGGIIIDQRTIARTAR